MEFLIIDHCVPCRVMCFAMCFAGNPIRWQIDHFRCIETHQTFDSLGVCWMQMSVNDFWAEDYWWACRVHTAQHVLFDSWFIQSTRTMESKSFAIGIWKVVFVFNRGGINAMVGSNWEKWGTLNVSLLCTYCTACALWFMIHSEYTHNGVKKFCNWYLESCVCF